MSNKSVSAVFAAICIAISAFAMLANSFQGLVFWGILAVVIGTFSSNEPHRTP